MKLTKTLKSKFKVGAICAVLGLLAGIIGTLFVSHFNPPDDNSGPTPSVVFERIVEQNELVCASQRYNITEKATDSASFFDIFDIPFTENSFWYRYVGNIKVAVNLENASYDTNGNTIKITLDQPYISSNTPNMEESGCLEERNNIFNPIHVEDMTAFEQKCIEQSEAEVVSGGIMDDARQNAEQNISVMFNAALGNFYQLEFDWRSDNSQTENQEA